MADANYILAGIAGGGASGSELAYFAPTGSTAPTNATAALDAAFLPAGYVSEDGLTKGVDEDTNTIRAYGSYAPVRTITKSSTVTFQCQFLETNKVSVAVYQRLGLSAITVTAGAFSVTEGPARTQRYAGVFEVIDGSRLCRVYCPLLEVTDREEFKVGAGEAVLYGVTMTAYPGTDGVAAKYFYVIPGLT